MKKIFVGTLVIIICAFAFTMNRTFRSIDNLAYVIALGIDVGTSNNVKISFQIAIPSGSEDTSSGGSSSDSSGKNYTISTVEASSINAAKTLVNSYISKELNLSKSTVSRAFRDSFDINPKTKQKILDAAKKLDFQPNTIQSNCTLSVCLSRKKTIQT